MKENNTGVSGGSNKLNPVWKGIWVVNKIMWFIMIPKNVGIETFQGGWKD